MLSGQAVTLTAAGTGSVTLAPLSGTTDATGTFTSVVTPGAPGTVTLTITADEPSRCPLARVLLPATMVAEDDRSCVPILGTSLEFGAIAVRAGTGPIRVVLHDLYQAEKVGLLSSVPIQVA